MRHGVAALAVAASFAGIGPAPAGWHYAEWGMTAEQVVAASGGAARLATTEELQQEREDFEKATRIPGSAEPPPVQSQIHRAKSAANLGDVTFQVNFDFSADDGTLNYIQMVNKTCSPANAATIESVLNTEFGEPAIRKLMANRPIRVVWQNPRGNSRIEWMYLNLSNSCYVSVAPMPAGQ